MRRIASYPSAGFVAGLLVGLAATSAAAQTVGVLVNEPGAYDAYTLFSPLAYTSTYLIDNEGRVINEWDSEFIVGNSSYLLEDGSLLRAADPGSPFFVTGGDAGLVERFDWEGNLTWSYLYSDDTVRHHHDIEPLPNGNVLILAFELKTNAEAIQAGRDPARLTQGTLWPEHIVEVEPVGADGGSIVWEWHMWDHLIQDFDDTKDNFGVVADHPELIDVNYGNTFSDWIHANSIDYNPELDQIVISANRFSELWIIDHSTTTAEAAGHTGGNAGRGGDILYRWGNPEAYDAGSSADTRLFNAHHAHWIEPGLAGAGRVMIFNNGTGRPGGNYTSIDEIVTTLDGSGSYPLPAPGMPHGPAAPVESYTAADPFDFYASFISGAERLPNGNLLVCDGPTGQFFEVTPADEEVWRYVDPVDFTGPTCQGSPPGGRDFRAYKYPLDYAAFDGRHLFPGLPIEDCVTGVASAPSVVSAVVASPNPFRSATTIRFELGAPVRASLRIFDVAGSLVYASAPRTYDAGRRAVTWSASGVEPGVYFYELAGGGMRLTGRLSKLE